MGEGVGGEEAVGGTGGVNGEDADLAREVFARMHVMEGSGEIGGFGVGEEVLGCWVFVGAGAAVVVVAEEEVVFENGEDFVGELVNVGRV